MHTHMPAACASVYMHACDHACIRVWIINQLLPAGLPLQAVVARRIVSGMYVE